MAAPQNPDGQVTARLRKQFQGGESGSVFPLLINAVDFTIVGADVFMDSGIVTPEAIQRFKVGEEAVDVQILFRVAMSHQTLLVMKQRIEELLRKYQESQAVAGTTEPHAKEA